MRRREIAALALLPWVGAQAAEGDAFAGLLREGRCAVQDEQAGQAVHFDDVAGEVRCPSNFVFQPASLMPPSVAELHAC